MKLDNIFQIKNIENLYKKYHNACKEENEEQVIQFCHELEEYLQTIGFITRIDFEELYDPSFVAEMTWEEFKELLTERAELV